jgi:hypothetical protein
MLRTYHTATLHAGHAATHDIGCKQFLQQSVTVFLYTNYTAQTGMFEENRTYSFFCPNLWLHQKSKYWSCVPGPACWKGGSCGVISQKYFTLY